MKTCKTCKHSKEKVVWKSCQYYDALDADYQDTIYVCDIDGSSYFGMQECKFYEPKPIKVKVRKCKR